MDLDWLHRMGQKELFHHMGPLWLVRHPRMGLDTQGLFHRPRTHLLVLNLIPAPFVA
jgi:hypothetical protein